VIDPGPGRRAPWHPWGCMTARPPAHRAGLRPRWCR